MKAGCAWLILLLLLFTGAGQTDDHSESKLKSSLRRENAGRLLLLAFTDRTINSIKAVSGSYRQRGSYGNSTWSERITDQIGKEYHLQRVAAWPMTEVGMHCVVYQLEDNSDAKEVIAKLAKDERIDVVQNMHYFRTQAETHNDPYFKLQSNLQNMQIEKAHRLVSGRGITIGIIDTGVDIDHPDLKGQFSKNKNLVPELSSSFASDKHGTAMAGVIAARKDNASGIIGIAPDVKLAALKACWPEKPEAMEAVCNSFSLALALNSAIKEGVDILNMSLTGPEDPLLAVLINKAMEEGIIVIAAAGSEASEQSENFPASLKGVIPVQSLEPSATVFPSSHHAISVPGNKVLTTLPYGTYDFISGSSISAAEVSGIVALLLEAKPHQSSADIYHLLFSSKKKESAAGIDVSAAVNRLCGKSGCSSNVLSYSLAP